MADEAISNDSSRPPLVADVRRNSLDDGPGIRSVVFFKGCPLKCVWCQNPETLHPGKQLQLVAAQCVTCGECVKVCPESVAAPAKPSSDSTVDSPSDTEPPSGRCRVCGDCVVACPSGARRLVGREYSIDELAGLLLRDAPFYRTSGGGVTFSGGEPTWRMEYAGRLAQELSNKDVHVLVETCGLFDWEQFEAHLLPHVSTVYFDVKLADPDLHKKFTGQHNRRILENLKKLKTVPSIELLPRVPLVPEITDTEENLSAIASLLSDLGFERVGLLPYNPLWVPKRAGLGLDVSYDRTEWMSPEEVKRCRQVFERAGLTVIE